MTSSATTPLICHLCGDPITAQQLEHRDAYDRWVHLRCAVATPAWAPRDYEAEFHGPVQFPHGRRGL